MKHVGTLIAATAAIAVLCLATLPSAQEAAPPPPGAAIDTHLSELDGKVSALEGAVRGILSWQSARERDHEILLGLVNRPSQAIVTYVVPDQSLTLTQVGCRDVYYDGGTSAFVPVGRCNGDFPVVRCEERFGQVYGAQFETVGFQVHSGNVKSIYCRWRNAS